MTATRERGTPTTTRDHVRLVERYAARNYAPLPVVLVRGEGAQVWDVEGRRYLDMLAGYSALNFGHRHPRLVAAMEEQLGRITLTSRAFHSEPLGRFCAELAELCGMEMVLPMNTGAEAVETAIKTARKWGYTVKGVPADTATLVVCDGNFHGRTTTIVSFSDDPAARAGFGPFTPGFRRVPYGDAEALLAAIDASTVAVLVEPVQGEAGVIVPPDGYLRAVRSACDRHGLLMLADEIQSGLGRTGDLFGCDREGVVPDVYILGKALGGGLLPLSAVVSRRDVLGVFGPGDHGSTFGGNPLACAVGLAVLELLKEGTVLAQGRERATQLRTRLAGVSAPLVREVRLEGLWAGIELAADGPTAREVCHRMADHGVLAKDTHVTTVRLAPPLVITADELDEGLDVLVEAIEVLAGGGR